MPYAKSKKYKKGLFIFRRDLRLEDNTGLNYVLEQAEEVLLAFIFTSEQILQNPYRSDRSLQFMLESLIDLKKACHKRGGELYLFFGSVVDVLNELLIREQIQAVVVNTDYTPYSQSRDAAIASLCNSLHIAFHPCEDALLHPPGQMLKSDRSPYTIFTPFFRNASQKAVPPPFTYSEGRLFRGVIEGARSLDFFKEILPNPLSQVKGGRRAALSLLSDLSYVKNYEHQRDIPGAQATTHLSPHLKYTTCSVREVYYAVAHQLGEKSLLLRSLFWRDFFSSIALYFPHVFLGAFHKKFDNLPWSGDIEAFKRWCDGTTGFPIVDAGMRELVQTGFMHNRVRMIVAHFLTKDLFLHWKWGEKFFAQNLIDYDPAVNNGNWQWAASTGCDAQPYFRLLNPWLQARRFDPHALYIKRWVPELAPYPPSLIHSWEVAYPDVINCPYPAPMVCHKVASQHVLQLYRSIALSKCTQK